MSSSVRPSVVQTDQPTDNTNFGLDRPNQSYDALRPVGPTVVTTVKTGMSDAIMPDRQDFATRRAPIGGARRNAPVTKLENRCREFVCQ